MSKAKAIIFDLDGTLVDSIPGLLEATNRVLLEQSRRILSMDEFRPMMGGGSKQLLDLSFKATGSPYTHNIEELNLSWQEHYRSCFITHSELFEGVELVLPKLKNSNYKLGICTSKPIDFSKKLLFALKIDSFFTSVIAKESTPYIKPHPAALQAVLDELMVSPNEAIMVGDSKDDIEAANALNIKSIIVSYGYSKYPVGSLLASAVIDKFEDLLGDNNFIV